jgi:hypothetical protein
MPDLRTNRWPPSGRCSYSDDDGGNHSLNRIEIDNSASDSSGHSGGATAAEAVAVVIMPPAARKKIGTFDLPQQRLLDSFQGASGSVWNHFKTGFFLLPPAAVLSIDGFASPKGLSV